MPRIVNDANLQTRTARLRLEARPEPFWRSLEKGLALGYRRNRSGGTWLARLHMKGAYREKRLGTADDLQDDDGGTILSYANAIAAAREWWQLEQRRELGLLDARRGPFTVNDALDDYLKNLAERGKATDDAKGRADLLIRPALGEMEVARLTTRQLRHWHHALANTAKRSRASKGSKSARLPDRQADSDTARKRQASANRTLTVLKAALNLAWKDGHVASDEAWRKVTPFKGVDAPVVSFLRPDELMRLVNACEPPFRDLVHGAVLTGCRYSELARLTASDFNPQSGKLIIRESKSGKPRHVVLTEEAQTFFKGLTAGRPAQQRIFLRADGKPWAKSHQQRPLAEACRRAGIEPAVSFHILRHTHGSMLAMSGVAMGVIAAQLGHADTRMTEKHYAHLAPSYVADTIRAHFPKLGIADETVVTPFRRKGV